MSNDPKYAAKKEAIGVSMNVLTKLWSDRISSSVKDDKKEIVIFNGRQGRLRQYSIYFFSDFLKEVIEKDELDTDDVCPKFVKSIAKEDRKPLIVELDVNELHNNEGVSLEEAERLESEIGKDVEVVNPENEEKVEKAGEPKKKRLRND
jgi:excinuclease UvrABC nuclease subunit